MSLVHFLYSPLGARKVSNGVRNNFMSQDFFICQLFIIGLICTPIVVHKNILWKKSYIEEYTMSLILMSNRSVLYNGHSLQCSVPLYKVFTLTSSRSNPPITRISFNGKTATAACDCGAGISLMYTQESVAEEYMWTLLLAPCFFPPIAKRLSPSTAAVG